ncbi:MAG: hypothetical protein WBM24_05470 [Candidatus Sulfotelmatobacter sp.]
MEASGQARWFEKLLVELQFELWIGDAAQIRTKFTTTHITIDVSGYFVIVAITMYDQCDAWREDCQWLVQS